MSRLSPTGLDSLSTGLADQVERGVVAGLAALVACGDQVHVVTAGMRDLGNGAPMRRDSLFRIASMTKPITAVAALILVEAGLLQMDAPIERWLPELADRRVLRSLEGPLDDTVPAKRSITLRDLLNFTFGFGVVMAHAGLYPIQQAVADAGVAPGPNAPAVSPDALAAAYGSLPLIHQPGEGWMYNSGTELAAVAIERAAGRPFADFLQDRIFAPLGMKDTGFAVPPAARDRVAGVYQVDDRIGFVRWPGSDAPPWPGGSTGLISTVDDYLAFARMLLAGGETILTRRSVAAMTSDQLTAAQKSAFVPGFWDGRGWGFGLGVTNDPAIDPPRGYGWDGGLGTSWRNDPDSGLIGILLTQRPMTTPKLPETASLFWRLAYAAVA